MRYFRYLLTTLVMLSIFVLSGAVFLAFLGFGMFGLSRIPVSYTHLTLPTMVRV